MFKTGIQLLASMKLSVVLLALAMVLVYVGTWAQIDSGTYEVQQRYFHSWLTLAPAGAVLPRNADGGMAIPGRVPMPGGYTVGLLMLLNLAANWFTRFRWTWDKAGIHLIHLGLILLLLGEAWAGVASVESRMQLAPNQTKSFAEDAHQWELAVIDRSAADHEQIWAVPEHRLRTGVVIADAGLPVQLRVDEYAANSSLLGPMEAGSAVNAKATAGAGVGVGMIPAAKTGGVENAVDVPAAYISVLDGSVSRGTYLLTWGTGFAKLDVPQAVMLGNGREYWLQLRPQRHVLPFELTLIQFRHDRFAGTEMARNFSSRVRLVDHERGVDREELIWMNHPLRYRGLTFYQASFSGEDTTVLQVVRNPAMVMPYVACAIGAMGLLVQFAIGLVRFNRRPRELPRNERKAMEGSAGGWAAPAAVGALAVCGLVAAGYWASVDAYDIAQAPVYVDGRLQPLDSLARNTLRVTNGSTSVAAANGESVSPVQWLMDGICRPEVAGQYRMVRIDNPEIRAMLSLDTSRKRFAPAEVFEKGRLIEKQTNDALATPASHRDLAQRQLIELNAAMGAYQRATMWDDLRLVPPSAGQTDWRPLGDVLKDAETTNTRPPHIAEVIASTFVRYQQSPKLVSNADTVEWLSALRSERPDVMAKMNLEVLYNRYQPFLWAMAMYVGVFLLACVSMLAWKRPLWRSAMVLGIVTLLLHSAAIGVRIYLQGRPPVTNLYSSAIFIGWGAVLLAVMVEFAYRNGVAIAAASLVSSASLIIAQNLAQSGNGDTMGALQAVLDSNFWLTTHVLAITYGYAAVFVAGGLGIAYVLAGMFGRRELFDERSASIARMIYGVSCFALVFSFVGTILGGIWADQSWGRFWGWDPKENGAVLIVLWLSITLHARWVGMGERGLALMAVFGNVVTAWSWFGTNMLGVGLHSYGFMDQALMWLLVFVGSQVVLIVVGRVMVPNPGVATQVVEAQTAKT